MKKRLLFMLVLALAILLPILTACGTDSTASDSASSGNGDETAPVPHLGKRDLDGFTLEFVASNRVYDADESTRKTVFAQYDAAELTDEPLNDILYERNRKIESDYNCVISLSVIPNVLPAYAEPIIRDLINAQANSFNVISGALLYSSGLTEDGLLKDFKALEGSHISLDADWWDVGLARQLTIDKKLYFVTGDAMTSDDGALTALFYNRDIWSELDYEDPYELVDSGNWTYDKFLEVIEGAGKYGDAAEGETPNDRWGLIMDRTDTRILMSGFGHPMVDRATDGPYIYTADTRAYKNVYDKLNLSGVITARRRERFKSIFKNERVVRNAFPTGYTLLAMEPLSFVNNTFMVESDVNYGVLPFPKYDTKQKCYYSPVNLNYDGFLSIPSNATQTDEITFILEAMAYLSKDTVTQKYYDYVLGKPDGADENDVRMLEIISENRIYDIEPVYKWWD